MSVKKAAAARGLTLDVFRDACSGTSPVCSLMNFMGRMTKADQAVTRQAILDPMIEGAAVTKVLRSLGFDCGRQVIGRHRREGCKTCHIGPLKDGTA